MSLNYNIREDEFGGEIFSASPLRKYGYGGEA